MERVEQVDREAEAVSMAEEEARARGGQLKDNKVESERSKDAEETQEEKMVTKTFLTYLTHRHRKVVGSLDQ